MSDIFGKMTRRTFGAGLAAATSTAILTKPARAAEIVGRMSYHWAPAHHSARYCQEFAKRVNERGEGKIRIDTFPSAQLFGIREIMGALTSGAVELGGVVGTVSFPPVNKNYNIEGLPGLFSDFEQLRGFFTDTEEGKEIWSNLQTRTRTRFLAYNPVGPYMTFTSKHALKAPADFVGLKARYLAGIERPRWEALGANAISLPTEEIYTSLQSGMIDTLSTVPSAIKAYSWWDYLKFGQKPYQFYADAFIMTNQAWWDGLPDDVKTLMTEVGTEISAASTESIIADSDATLEEFVAEQGGQVDAAEGEALEAFRAIDRDKVYPVVSDLIEEHVLAAAQKYVSG